MTLNIFGHSYQRARKDHVCWLCGDAISKGDKYFRTAGAFNGRMFSVKHCRARCECAGEGLEQNPNVAPGVFYPTLSAWMAMQ